MGYTRIYGEDRMLFSDESYNLQPAYDQKAMKLTTITTTTIWMINHWTWIDSNEQDKMR